MTGHEPIKCGVVTTCQQSGARRISPSVVGGLLGVGLALCLLMPAALEGRPAGSVQGERHPAPQTYHWVLPAQYDAVEVTHLHPNDCYVIQQTSGVVSFGEPTPDVVELQRQLGEPVSHLVESLDDHPECLRGECLDVARLIEAITARLLESGNPGDYWRAGHRSTPLDGMQGGVYSDVGSVDRPRYRRAPEQRMAYLHLGTAGRGNCYEAKVPRTLTVHIRDGQRRADRAGAYSGYLYLEHHHPAPPGGVAHRRPPVERLGAGPDVLIRPVRVPAPRPERGAGTRFPLTPEAEGA